MMILGSTEVFAMSGGKQDLRTIHPIVTEVRGDVKVKGVKYGIWEPVEKRMLVLSGDMIKTGPDSQVRLEFASGMIDLYSSTLLFIPSISVMDLDVTLAQGKAKFDISHRDQARQFHYRTGNSSGQVKGTLFVVHAEEGQTMVAVYRGAVDVMDASGSEASRVSLVKGDYVTINSTNDINKVATFDVASIEPLILGDVEPVISEGGFETDDADREIDKDKNGKGKGGKDKGGKDKDK
jgi:hypothetical protein